MIQELDGRFHLRLDANDRGNVLMTMLETDMSAVFLATAGNDLLVVVNSLEDAVYLGLMFR